MLFNYLIHSGKALRLGKFIREVGRRQGKREGRLEGVEEGQRAEALRMLKRCSPKVWPWKRC
ncbi:hypothetical protein SB6413_03949 [Klebsiella pasteurii]|uniref:hypothetical protein n=2 Tax=Klebsiella TaxID=570 RepID=UPI0011748CB5|nr:hypothetical protein SB6414_04708 [Klebsiella pasteurii]VUS75673.1 hypothetical protein SB6413_03949 [Klebsiella pasteurii]VUT01195.1 hypothetical protein SB6407_05027 [Klebsiella pasteurii]